MLWIDENRRVIMGQLIFLGTRYKIDKKIVSLRDGIKIISIFVIAKRTIK